MSRAVIDQPGLRVLVIGVALSLILGLGIKFQVRQEKIDQILSRGISNLKKDFRIDYGAAQIKLSKWGWPYPHLLLTQIRISPHLNACQDSQIYIDELELPLTLDMFFNEQPKVEKIRAKNFELRLSDIGKCQSLLNSSKKERVQKSFVSNESVTESNHQNLESQAQESSSTESHSINQQSLVQAPVLIDKPTRAVLNEVVIENLKIINSSSSDQPLLFRQMHFYFSYFQNRLQQVDFKSKFYALRDLRNETYYLVTDLQGTIGAHKEFGAEFSLRVNGRWLDGIVSGLVQGQLLHDKIHFDLKAQKVSTKALAPLIRRLNPTLSLERWPLIVNFEVLGSSQNIKKQSQTRVILKDVSASGDKVSLNLPEVVLTYESDRVFVEPFVISANGLGLSPLKFLLPENIDLKSIESLGRFTGEFRYSKRDDWNLKGILEDSEVIFSNRGQRELLKVDQVKVLVKRKKNTTEMSLNELVVGQSPIEGQLEGQYLSQEKAVSLKADLVGPLFPNRIWQQFTEVLQNPMIKLNWSYKKSSEERHQIKLSLSELNLPGIKLENLQIDFAQINTDDNKSLFLNAKWPTGDVDLESIKYSALNTIISNDEIFKTPKYKLSKSAISLQGENWRNMKFDLDSALTSTDSQTPPPTLLNLKSKGSWNQIGEISGEFIISHPLNIFKFLIQKFQNSNLEIKLINNNEN